MCLSSRKTLVLGWASVVPCECDFCGPPAAKVVSCREGESGGSGGGGGGEIAANERARAWLQLHFITFSVET